MSYNQNINLQGGQNQNSQFNQQNNQYSNNSNFQQNGDEKREFNRRANPEKQQRLLNNFNNVANNIIVNPNLNDYKSGAAISNSNSNGQNGNSNGNSNSKGTGNNNNTTGPGNGPNEYAYPEQQITSYNPNSYPNNTSRTGSRQSRNREDNNNNYQRPQQPNFDEQLRQINFHQKDQESLVQEVNGMKKLLKYVMESQTEIQRKVIDYNKFISEQENISRLNNLKINEHDSKLTEILITFNNYLKLNDNSTTLINNLTLNYENTAKKHDVNDLKQNLININKNADIRFGEFGLKYDQLLNKYTETVREQEVFQKYTLEKLKIFQNETIESKIEQQQALIRLEDSRDQKYNHQFDQLKLMLSTIEKNLYNESLIRKNSQENLKDELTNYLRNFEEKMSYMEKNNLETEKKIITFSKEYITGMKDLFSQHNQKTDIELQALKSLIDTNIYKIENKVDEERERTQIILVDMKNSIELQATTISELETSLKDNIEMIDNKTSTLTKDMNSIIDNNSRIDSTVSSISEEITILKTKLNNEKGEEELAIRLDQLKREMHDLNLDIKQIESTHEKKFEDDKDRLDLFRNEFKVMNIMIEDKIKDKFDKNQEKLDNVQEKIYEKLSIIKLENEDFQKKLGSNLGSKLESSNKKVLDDQNYLVDNLQRNLEDKIKVLQKDIKNEIKEDEILQGGWLQTFVLEAENRIKKTIEERLRNIDGEMENLNIKLSLVDNKTIKE